MLNGGTSLTPQWVATQAATKSGAEGSVPSRNAQTVGGTVHGLRRWVGEGTMVRTQWPLGEAMVQTEGMPPKIRVEDEKARKNH